MVLPEGCELTLRRQPKASEPGEIPSALADASKATRDLYARRERTRPRLPVVTLPPSVSLAEMAEALRHFFDSGGKLAGLRKQKQRERLEAEIRADLEYGQGTA